MKVAVLFILVLFTTTVNAQTTINNYKYVLVPERYDFFKTDNQYGLNTLTKYLLEGVGFTALLGKEALPPQVVANKCNALNVELVEKKSFFVTSLTLLLKDCQGNVIFKSKEGKSREKEYPAAYNEALQEAFTSFKGVYKYDSTAVVQTQPVVVTPAAPAAVAQAPAPASTAPAITDATGTLYAQPTTNGFQLIDTTPKKVLTLLKTSTPDYYIAEGGASSGIVFKKNDEWIFEYYKNDKLVSQKLQIKF